MAVNFHNNFKDLNPAYHLQRRQRAVKVANRYIKTIGDKLKDKHQEESRRIFRNKVQDGMKLTFNELRVLSDEVKKLDYIK